MRKRMSKISKFIKRAFNEHPIITNAVVYGTLYVGAEFSQQTVTKKILKIESHEYNHQSLTNFGILGVAVFPPIFYHWYTWLDKKFVGKTLKIICQKVLIDQFLFTPQILVLFFVAMSVMEKKKDLLEECQQKFIPTFKSSCLFWTPAQAINFLIIPPTFRVAYVGTCSFAWVNILCWIKRQEY